MILRKYIDELENRDIDTEEFIEYYYDFALIRLIQMLGSYAYLDKSEKKININRKILKAKISFEEIYNETELDASKKLVEIILENHY